MKYYQGMLVGSLLLSGWVIICPWFVDDAGVPPASWNFYVVGALGLLLSMVGLVRSDDLPGYGLTANGAWLAVSPWMLDLAPTTTRQAVFYAVVLAGLGWAARPSYQPKAAEG